MRGFLVLGFCVAALSLTFQDLSLSHAGNDIAKAFNAELLSFDPVKVSNGHELQAANPNCQAAWGALSGMLQNQTDPCNAVILVFQNLQNANWTDGAVAAYLANFCLNGGGACVQKYQQAYDTMIAACGSFSPSDIADLFGNQTDRLARTVRALINVPCLTSTVVTPYTAPAYTDPLFGNPMPNQTYPNTFCWLHFKWLLSVNLDTVVDADLTDRCNECALRITDWITKQGINQLALAARQARAFCDKKHDPVSNAAVFCAPKLKDLRRAAADPNFQANLKANNAQTAQALATFCHPCVKWGMQLAYEVQNLLIQFDPTYNTSYRDQLKNSTDALAVTCVRDLKENYCVAVLAEFTLDALIAQFAPCLSSFGCTNTTNPDPCAVVIYELYRKVGCCLSSFVRGLKYATGSAAAAASAVPTILNSCGFQNQIPSTCSQKKVIAHFPLRNVAHAYVGMDAVKAKLPVWFASNLGIDASAITNVTCWEANATTKTTSCDVHFFPDSSATAGSFVADFTYNVQNGLQYLAEVDIASLEFNAFAGGARVDQSADAYQAADFSVEVVEQCLNFKPPAAATLVNGTCVPLCENGMKDGSETDVDCGGLSCNTCGDGKQCAINSDCTSPLTCGLSDSKASVCKSGVAALLANPLLLLVGAFLALFLL